MARNYDLAIGEVEAGTILYELINISFQRGLRLPAELTLLAKALFNLDAVTRVARSDLQSDPHDSRVRQSDRRRPSAPGAESAQADAARYADGGDLLTALPHRLDLVTQRLAAGEFATRVEVPQLRILLEWTAEGREPDLLRSRSRRDHHRQRDVDHDAQNARHLGLHRRRRGERLDGDLDLVGRSKEERPLVVILSARLTRAVS